MLDFSVMHTQICSNVAFQCISNTSALKTLEKNNNTIIEGVYELAFFFILLKTCRVFFAYRIVFVWKTFPCFFFLVIALCSQEKKCMQETQFFLVMSFGDL